MKPEDEKYLDARFEGVENEISSVHEKVGGLETTVNDNMHAQMAQGKEILDHIMDMKEKTAHQNGAIGLATQKAKTADKKAEEAKGMASDAHNRISSIILKVLMIVLTGIFGGGGLLYIFFKAFP